MSEDQSRGDVSERNDAAIVISLFAETPLHPGTGQSTGIVDLPIQREKHTGFPIIPSTSLKGSLREVATQRWTGAAQAEWINVLFGPQVGQGDLYAGALGFTDARLLAFPVRSLSQVFLWIACPLTLGRLQRDLRLARHDSVDLNVSSPEQGRMNISPESDLAGTVVLEDLSFTCVSVPDWETVAARIATLLPSGEPHRVYREKMAKHLVLVSDDDFAYLVRHATPVAARIALNDKKTTAGDRGNLWYEETIPPDALFYCLVRPDRPRVEHPALKNAAQVSRKFLELLSGDPFYLQVGGNETVGYGWCASRVLDAWPAQREKRDA